MLPMQDSELACLRVLVATVLALTAVIFGAEVSNPASCSSIVLLMYHWCIPSHVDFKTAFTRLCQCQLSWINPMQRLLDPPHTEQGGNLV